MSKESAEDKSLLDWLTDLFETDIGEGHLECCSAQDEEFELSLLVLKKLIVSSFKGKQFLKADFNSSAPTLNRSFNLILPRDTYSSSAGLRAAPSDI